MDISVILPVIDERENLCSLIPRLKNVLTQEGLSFEIIVVDGGSRDGTQAAAAEMGARVVAERRRGYGGALETGFAEARGDYVLTLDADLSHDPDFVAAMWQARTSADVVVASRYVKGGAGGGDLVRRAASRFLNFGLRLMLRVPIRDLSSGFRLYRRKTVEGLKLEGRNFEVLEEVLIKAYARGARVAEVPMVYQQRGSGRSHARLFRFGIDLARASLKLRKLLHSNHVAMLAFAAIVASMLSSCARRTPVTGQATVKMGKPVEIQEVVSADKRERCSVDAMKICASFGGSAPVQGDTKTVSLAIPNAAKPLEIECRYSGESGTLASARPLGVAALSADTEAFLSSHGFCRGAQGR
jgi:dolichol-phosphate mannosyltransferase